MRVESLTGLLASKEEMRKSYRAVDLNFAMVVAARMIGSVSTARRIRSVSSPPVLNISGVRLVCPDFAPSHLADRAPRPERPYS